MPKVTVVCGGSVGYDPRSPRTWSGSSLSLVSALHSAGMLDSAVGIRVAPVANALLIARNWNRKRAAWRSHYYFDPRYRSALTRAAKSITVASPFLLQLGHMFCLPEVFPQKKCISYHDGNLVELINSGFGLTGISPKRIDQALRYEEQAANEMDAVFTFSEYLRQSFISDYHVPSERVVNIGGGVNLTELPPVNSNKTYTAPRILFVGSDFIRKGGSQLLEAFRRVRETLPGAELHIVGPEKLDSLPQGVVFHGRLSKADPGQKRKLESLFEDSSLFVLPSLYEPFGIAPLEAMLYQLPCLATNAWAFREFITPGFNGDLVTKGSVDDLSAKINQLLSEPERLASMGRQGRELVLSQFTWSAVVGRISSAIQVL